MSKTTFLPKDYEVPAGAGTDFMKFEDGENRFRILTAPVLGWEGWKDNKPFHREGVEKNIEDDEVDIDEKFSGKPKVAHFWAFVVWDYQAEKICVLQLKQKTIMKTIQELSEDEDWGSPLEYDLTVTKRKEGDFIKYAVKAAPQKAIKPSIEEAFEESDIDLNDIFFAEKETAQDVADELNGKSKKSGKKAAF